MLFKRIKGKQKRARSAALKTKEVLDVLMVELPKEDEDIASQTKVANNPSKASKKRVSPSEETSSTRHTKPRVEEDMCKDSDPAQKWTYKGKDPAIALAPASWLAKNFNPLTSVNDLLNLASEITNVPKIKVIDLDACDFPSCSSILATF